MDRQMCSLVIQSSAHPLSELRYHWHQVCDHCTNCDIIKPNDPLLFTQGIEGSKLAFMQGLEYQDSMTPAIRLVGYRFREMNSTPSSMDKSVYSQLVLDVFLERPLGYFLWEVYMPATFIVVISFTSFWLDRAATPARVSLGKAMSSVF